MDLTWQNEEWILDVQIENRQLRRGYTSVQNWSRQLTIGILVLALTACFFERLSAVACGLKFLTLVFAFMTVTRVVTDEGGIVSAVPTPLEAEETVKYSDKP